MAARKIKRSSFDNIKDSAVAKMELNDGTVIYVDSEIDSLKSIAYMEFAILEDPDAMEKNGTETVVLFYGDYPLPKQYVLTS